MTGHDVADTAEPGGCGFELPVSPLNTYNRQPCSRSKGPGKGHVRAHQLGM